MPGEVELLPENGDLVAEFSHSRRQSALRLGKGCRRRLEVVAHAHEVCLVSAEGRGPSPGPLRAESAQPTQTPVRRLDVYDRPLCAQRAIVQTPEQTIKRTVLLAGRRGTGVGPPRFPGALVQATLVLR